MDTPYATARRPDTGVTNATLGIWLFLASEVMLFGSLFSAYALLRSGAATWPDQSAVLNVPLGTVNTVVLLAASAAIAGGRLKTTLVLGIAFLGITFYEYVDKLVAGLTPAVNNFLGLYYVMTGLHAVHLAGGLLVVSYLAGPGARLRLTQPQRFAQRVRVTALYWYFVGVIWIALFVVLYLL